MTLRLINLADHNWATIDGWFASHNLHSLIDIPADRFFNVIYFWAIKDGDPEEVVKFDRRLWIPPKGVAVTEGPWSPQAETDAFNSLAAALNVKP